MNIRQLALARKYAQAFVTVFGIHNTWIAPMESLTHIFKNNSSLLILLTLPQVSAQQKVAMFHTCCAQMPCASVLKRLLTILIADRQVLLLGRVLEEIVALYHEQQGIIRCTIDSSHTLHEDDKYAIQQYIQCMSKSTAQCVFNVKPRLIAGVRIQAPTFFWQYSIRAQLQALRTTLMR